MRSFALLFFLLNGCIEEVGRGPDLGACATPPEGTYTFGQVGVGTCLANPADIAFWQDSGGKTWLGVANANHHYNFESGSVLLIDWDSVDTTPGTTQFMSDLSASALPAGHYIGGLAPVPTRDLLLATERFSEGATTSAHPDDLIVIDVADPTSPSPWASGDRLTLQDDPQPIVVDEAGERAYVLNLTDHSISVVDLSTTPLETVEVSLGISFTTGEFEDADGSGSTSVFSSTEVIDEERVIDDHWQLTWVEGTTRLWVPRGQGLERWHSGGNAWAPTGSGVEVDPTLAGLSEISDPFFYGVGDFPGLFFASDGDLYVAGVSDGTGTNWVVSASPVLDTADEDAFDVWLDAPSYVDDGLLHAIYYEARPAQNGVAVISGAFEDTAGQLIRSETPLLAAPAGVQSMTQPYVLFDTQTQAYRMWMSMWDGGQWEIGVASSPDGVLWSDPVVVAGLTEHAAAPVVIQARGRYILWYTHGDGETWSYASAWSWDGLIWFESSDWLASSQTPFDLSHPPRLAAQASENGGFRVEGEAAGLLAGNARPGVPFTNVEYGLTLTVSSGYEADGAALHENFANGLSPASAVDLSETRALFVHGLGEDGHGYIGLLNTNGTPPTLMSSDVLPAAGLGSLADPSHPVVFAHNDGYRMVFSATATDGKIGLFLAESTDGFSWSVSHTPLLDDASSWHAAAKFGRSIEWTDEGAMRLWYSGSNGSRLRIGSAIWDEASGQFSPEPAATTDWIFGTGVPGQFDDSHVSDPMVFQFDGQTHLLYSAFNGETWYIGHATRSEDGSFERSLNGQGLIRPVLSGQSLTFSHDGADSPVVWTEDGSLSIWYAGHEGDVAEGSGTRRLGVATGQPTALFANQKVPTAGDTLFFDTSRSDNDTQVIELSQRIEAFTTASSGASGLRLDAERGFLYVTAKGNNYIYVIDIRDDSTDTFADRNYLDIEALISVESNVGSRGFRDVIAPPGTGLLYAAAQRPDAILVFDLSSLEDNADKEVYRDLAIGSLPLQPSSGNGADQGEETGLSFSERFGGGQMALSESGLLLVTQFLDNSVSIFDLAGGDLGSEVAYLPHVGENPYAVAISPDGHYAVVANYLGKELDNGAHSSTLLVIDINPESPTFLTPLTWISNR